MRRAEWRLGLSPHGSRKLFRDVFELAAAVKKRTCDHSLPGDEQPQRQYISAFYRHHVLILCAQEKVRTDTPFSSPHCHSYLCGHAARGGNVGSHSVNCSFQDLHTLEPLSNGFLRSLWQHRCFEAYG
jgi:hypothetical protein